MTCNFLSSKYSYSDALTYIQMIVVANGPAIPFKLSDVSPSLLIQTFFEFV